MGEVYSHLSEEERQVIRIEIGNGTSIRRIGLMLGRNASTVGVDPTVDGLRAHAHGGVVGEQDAQPAADGQRRPAATQPFGHPRPQAFA